MVNNIVSYRFSGTHAQTDVLGLLLGDALMAEPAQGRCLPCGGTRPRWMKNQSTTFHGITLSVGPPG